MKTIKNSKEITTLEVGDKVIFGDLKYIVTKCLYHNRYYLELNEDANDRIFRILHLKKEDFIEKLGINADYNCDFPEIISLETLTAIVSALFKEYEKQNELPKTWEEFCEKYPLKEEETFINSDSELNTVRESFGRRFRLCEEDKNLCTSREEAEAFLAFKQLRQLRKAYVKDWEPNWNMPEIKYVIKVIGGNCFQVIEKDFEISSLSFPTYKLAQQFTINFKDLLEIAKPLL
jgi:hypothetical protein